jgi:hypothetical protein
MSRIEHTYNQIVRYLNGLLSNRERHDLEKEMMRDTFDEEAFEGLNQLSAGELEADIDVLMKRLDERIQPKKKRNLVTFYRMAAAIILLVGVGSILYVFFRTPSQNLITRETSHEKLAPLAETAIPAGPLSPVNKDAKTESEIKANGSPETKKKKTPGPAKTNVAVNAPGEPIEILSEKGVSIADQASAPAISRQMDTQPLVNEPAGKDVALNDDMIALNEMIVLDYKKKNEIPAVATGKEIESESKADADMNQALQGKVAGVEVTRSATRESGEFNSNKEAEMYNLIKPVPYGGSLKTFKQWVENRIDNKQFKAYPGKHRIQISLTVHTDGTITDIKVKNNVPPVIADEYRRVISQSPVWQPALKDNAPVEAEVMIRFVVEVE